VERLTREHYTAGVYVVAGASVQLCESYLTAQNTVRQACASFWFQIWLRSWRWVGDLGVFFVVRWCFVCAEILMISRPVKFHDSNDYSRSKLSQ